jgi:hypothetical protein
MSMGFRGLEHQLLAAVKTCWETTKRGIRAEHGVAAPAIRRPAALGRRGLAAVSMRLAAGASQWIAGLPKLDGVQRAGPARVHAVATGFVVSWPGQ